MRQRREFPAPLPGTAKIRITADPETAKRLLSVLTAYFTCTTPAEYSGSRFYLDLDTRPIPLPHPAAE